MKLTFEKTPKKLLEIERPSDGNQITLEIKNITVSNARENEANLKDIEREYRSGEIDSVEYMFATMKLLVKDFEQAFFEDFEVSHMMKIVEAVRELQEGKTNAEKKSPSETR